MVGIAGRAITGSVEPSRSLHSVKAATSSTSPSTSRAPTLHALRAVNEATPRERIRASVVNAPLSTAGFSRIASSSLADCGRADGSFSRQRNTASSSAAGISGLIRRGGSGASVRCARSTAATDSRGKTGRPQSAS